ncbi:DNA/RNA non-specific endonuclease [Motilibacter aurantiacus]|uniref:DNA/RNA non-specific endonuclease n=1 Tax=Motilibacter aurantiacus TaxID=2714955 RepID=UPI001407AD95|nr:DNA/RNA non-specific endonuclease [Motilibacter aurantiacus]NHC44974.1 DNA/RNA non-specific endonuclease [Motilibacter aurantiacus]
MTSPELGYDPAFLGVDAPFPHVRGVETALLDYTHFSIAMHPDRRLAAVTGVVIDGAQIVEVERSRDRWSFDPRLPASAQTGEDVYADNDLDRGHLVRRRDPAWGAPQVAERANADTFFFTNCAPQASAFNQGLQLWNGLENYLLDNAVTGGRRLAVFTGPVFADDDPPYRGALIPRRFYKVAAFMDAGELAATAYVLDQTPQLPDLELSRVTSARAATGDAPPLGPFRTFQAPVADVAQLTGLDLGVYADVDRYAPAAGVREQRWRLLTGYGDVVLS